MLRVNLEVLLLSAKPCPIPNTWEVYEYISSPFYASRWVLFFWDIKTKQWRVETLHNHTLTSLCFFSLLDHGSSHTTCTNRDDDLWSFCARFRKRPEVEFSFWFSTYHHQSALLRLGIAIAVRQVKPALLWKKKERKFSRITGGRSNSSQKNARWRSWVFKKSPKTSLKPKAPELEHLAPNLSKARETKKALRNRHNSGGKEIISSFERNSSIDSLAQNIPEWPSPSHAHNLSFTHDGYIRHTATEMIILMTDISVMWHSTGKSASFMILWDFFSHFVWGK